jgi:hypothetical protein
MSSQSPFTLHGLQPGIGVKMHPLAGPQVSVVQASPSSQASGVPRVHVPAWHVSSPLQTSASAHDVPSGSVVFWQTPPTQASPVHGFPSLQSAVMAHDRQPAIGVWMQPVSELHVSVVHASPSSQESGVPAVQVPLWQVSFPLQTSWSAHEVPSSTGALVQPSAASHASLVHGFESSQLGGVPGAHVPA